MESATASPERPPHPLHPRRLRAVMVRVRARPAASTLKPVPRKNLTAVLREWHRRFGLFAFVFMGWLGISGVLLNEASNLDLDSRRVSTPLLMQLYGMKAEPPASGFGADGHWLAVAGGKPALDGRRLDAELASPGGLVAGGELLYVGQPESLVLLSPDGTRIDELRMPPLPVATLRRIGRVPGHAGSIAIQGTDSAYESLDRGESWTPVAADGVEWSARQPLPAPMRAALLPLSQPSVSMQQLLVDLHSGRLFGRFGSLFVDVVGGVALILAVSGVWMTWRISRARSRQASPPPSR